MQDARRVRRDRVERRAHAVDAGHLRDVQTHRRNLQHVGAAERIPGVHHAVVSERDGDARLHQFGHTRHAAALRVRVVASLQRDVDQRIRDRAHLGLADQRDQFGHVIVVHRVHRGQVRAGDAALQPQALRLVRERLDVPRHRIIGFVAMHVDEAALVRGDLAQHAHAFGAVAH